jgi:hypothetical protein
MPGKNSTTALGWKARAARGGPLAPQLLDLSVPVVLDPAALADVVVFRFLLLVGVAFAQAVAVEDLELGELGLGLPPGLRDLLQGLGREGLFPGPLDPLLLEPFQGELVSS